MNVDLHPGGSLNTLSICTGGGGLDLGVELAIPGARPVCLVERESFACAHLVETMRQGLMAQAPIWTDARTFNGRPWRGLVDGVVGGIPCQPHSLAGKRLGRDDERDLWGTFRRITVQAGAWWVLIENVGGMLSSGGAERVHRDLQRMGFAVEGGLFRASEVGASHERERLFILGVGLANTEGLRSRARLCEGRSFENGACTACGRGSLAHAGHAGLQGRRSSRGGSEKLSPPERDRRKKGNAPGNGRREGRAEHELRGRGDSAPGSIGELVDTLSGRCSGRPESEERGPEQRALDERASGPTLFPPGPDDIATWAQCLARAPDLEPAFRRVADGVASRLDTGRVDRLRMLGNGVVPLQAAYALRTLATDLARRAPSAAFLVRMMEAA